VLDHFHVIHNAIEVFHHRHGLAHAQEFSLGRAFTQTQQRAGMVRLHVVGNHIVQIFQPYQTFKLLKKIIGKSFFGKVNQRIFLILNQIGIVGNALIQDGPQTLKELCGAVVDANPIDVWSDFDWSHGVLYAPRNL